VRLFIARAKAVKCINTREVFRCRPSVPCRRLECQLEPSSRPGSWAWSRRRCSWLRSRSLKPLVQAALPRGNSATKLARVMRLGPRRWRPIGPSAPPGHERARAGRDRGTGRDDPDRFGTRLSEAQRPQAHQSSVRCSSCLLITRSRTCASIRRSGAVARADGAFWPTARHQVPSRRIRT
jgi:hypothetical protein